MIDAVKNDWLKKTLYYNLVTKVNTIDSGKQNLEKEIKKVPDTRRCNEAQDFNRSTTININ